MNPTTPKTRGGHRPGSGRKRKAPTVTVSVRVPEGWAKEIKLAIVTKLIQLKEQHPKSDVPFC